LYPGTSVTIAMSASVTTTPTPATSHCTPITSAIALSGSAARQDPCWPLRKGRGTVHAPGDRRNLQLQEQRVRPHQRSPQAGEIPDEAVLLESAIARGSLGRNLQMYRGIPMPLEALDLEMGVRPGGARLHRWISTWYLCQERRE
jgi:hypothetical protein